MKKTYLSVVLKNVEIVFMWAPNISKHKIRYIDSSFSNHKSAVNDKN